MYTDFTLNLIATFKTSTYNTKLTNNKWHFQEYTRNHYLQKIDTNKSELYVYICGTTIIFDYFNNILFLWSLAGIILVSRLRNILGSDPSAMNAN